MAACLVIVLDFSFFVDSSSYSLPQRRLLSTASDVLRTPIYRHPYKAEGSFLPPLTFSSRLCVVGLIVFSKIPQVGRLAIL